MSIIEKNKVDAIGVEKDTGILVLSISDHLDWSDSSKHLVLLQEKLNSYLVFIKSGELLKNYPRAKNRMIRIDLFSKYKCFDDKSNHIIGKMQEKIKQTGYSFEIKYI